MSGPFKVGDLVEIVGPCERPENIAKVGLTATIVTVWHDCESKCFPDGKAYWLDIDGEYTNDWGWRTDSLRRKPPKADYDGNQAGSWDLIPYWQPNKMREQA